MISKWEGRIIFCPNMIFFDVFSWRNITTSFPSSVDLSNERSTSPKGGKDWALVTFQFKINIRFIKTMFKSMYPLAFRRRHELKAVSSTSAQYFSPLRLWSSGSFIKFIY